jgi:transposase
LTGPRLAQRGHQDANHVTGLHVEDAVLAVSLELSAAQWKVALHDGLREKPEVHTGIAPQAEMRLQAVLELIERHRKRWSLPSHVRVVISYEAGQHGFWMRRALSSRGIDCYTVDAASIPVERHKRRAKTDRLDAIRLVTNLRAWLHGERDRMRVVRAPAEQDEVDHRSFATRLAHGELACHDGTPFPDELGERLLRETARLELAEQQLEALARTLQERLPAPVRERVAYLRCPRGVGQIGASRLMLELFWRQFNSRRQLGACVGLVPQPYESGQSRVHQGISKQGSR